tara:strand:+ start:237 stop:536 length:300 start_codon:yes stop_codon:yes gene_type:complete
MFKLAKYEFNSLEQANSKIESLGEHPHTIIRLRFIEVEKGEYDDEGNVIKEPVYSDKYSVDTIWKGIDSHPYGWKSYYIEVEGNGSHKVSGVDYQSNKI